MTVYVSTSCLAPSGGFYDVIKTYRAAGITNIELGSTHRYSPEISADGLKDNGCHYLCHHYFPPPEHSVIVNLASTNPSILNASKNHIRNCLDFCQEMGISLFTFHAGFRADPQADPRGRFEFPRDEVVPYETAFNIFVDTVEEINAYALKKGVKIGIENNVLSDYNVIDGQNPFLLLCEAWEFDELWQRIPSENVGVLLDLGHLKPTAHWLKFDPEQFIESVTHHIVAFHIHENGGMKDQHLPVTETSWCLDVISRDVFRGIPVIIESSGLTTEDILAQVHLVEASL